MAGIPSGGERLPGAFDVAQIAGVPITIRSLIANSPAGLVGSIFRDEYIFDVEKAVVVGTPQLGHATYVFGKYKQLFALYTKLTKHDIRRNRNHVAEWLGFLGRALCTVTIQEHGSRKS